MQGCFGSGRVGGGGGLTSHADVLEETRDEPLRTSAWEALLYKFK